ncbi:MAG TPA: peptidoglycan-binding domain-containing protein, partial [Methylobacterium sp.]|nr:peptidoglycan-binding domain-containing protein [Methylobacterium sp.]
MMREPLKARDQREITVAGEARPTRPGTAARRRPMPRTGAATGEMRAAVGAFAGGLVTLCRQHPGEVVGSLVAVGAAAFVALNALGFQVGRHPAPILPKIATRQEAPGRKPTPDKLAQAQGPVQGIAQAATIEKSAAKPDQKSPEGKSSEAKSSEGKSAETKSTESASRDPIGALIRSEDTTASVTPKADKAVMQAQRALSKLGYGPLKADGMMGTNTRAAIEKFERDRKLP